MRPLGSRYIWLKLTLAVGFLLGLLLLVQSVITYYQVSRLLITAELRKQAQQHVASIEREARRFGVRDPAELSQVLEDIRQDPPGTIAWIRIVDMSGHPLAQSGNSAGLPFRQARLREALAGFTAASEIRQAGTRQVLVTVLAL
jgi:hypothetical protein